jgi:hypothetical protein
MGRHTLGTWSSRTPSTAQASLPLPYSPFHLHCACLPPGV